MGILDFRTQPWLGLAAPCVQVPGSCDSVSVSRLTSAMGPGGGGRGQFPLRLALRDPDSGAQG